MYCQRYKMKAKHNCPRFRFDAAELSKIQNESEAQLTFRVPAEMLGCQRYKMKAKHNRVVAGFYICPLSKIQNECEPDNKYRQSGGAGYGVSIICMISIVIIILIVRLARKTEPERPLAVSLRFRIFSGPKEVNIHYIRSL